MLLPRMTRLIENLVRLTRSKPLVQKMDWQATQLPQLRCKSLRLESLWADLARQVHRIPHHNPHHPKPPRNPRQGSQIIARIALSLQSHHRLSRQPEFIRHSHPDAPIADVQSEIARLSFQLLVSLEPSGWAPSSHPNGQRPGMKSQASPDSRPIQSKVENPHGEFLRLNCMKG